MHGQIVVYTYGWKIGIHRYASDSEILTHIALQNEAGRKSTGKNYPIKSPQSCKHLELVLKALQKECSAVNISSSLILSRFIQSTSPSEEPLIHFWFREKSANHLFQKADKIRLRRVVEKYQDFIHSQEKTKSEKNYWGSESKIWLLVF